jgi:hypothetical protein
VAAVLSDADQFASSSSSSSSSSSTLGGGAEVVRAATWLLCTRAGGGVVTHWAARWLELAALHARGREALRAVGGVRVLTEAVAASGRAEAAEAEAAALAGLGGAGHALGLLLRHDGTADDWHEARLVVARAASVWAATVAPTEELEVAIWGLAMAGAGLTEMVSTNAGVNKWIGKQRQLREPSPDQTEEPRSQNVELIGRCKSVRRWSSFLGCGQLLVRSRSCEPCYH